MLLQPLKFDFEDRPMTSFSVVSILAGDNILWIQPSIRKSGPNSVKYGIANPGQSDRWYRCGSIEFYDGTEYLIRKQELVLRMSEDGPIVGSVAEEYRYYPPTAAIPVHHLKERICTQSLTKQPTILNKYMYTDYKIETLPSERLHLSYYGLPNELVEDETTTYRWFWWTLALVTVIIVIAFCRRFNRMRIPA
jgi:hypothetical protein